MKNCLISVFSGTGNTKRIAEFIKESLSSSYVTEIQEIPTSNDSNITKEADLLGFGYPIHAFNAPEIFIDFIKSLPEDQGKKCFLFESSGEGLKLNNGSSALAIRILKKKGYIVLSDRHYLMPYNIIARHEDSMVLQMLVYSHCLARAQAVSIISETIEPTKRKVFLRLWSRLFRIEWFYAKAAGPRMKVDNKKCCQCMKCINLCPTKNISFIDGKFVFGKSCALCLRCSFYCPKDAISLWLLNGWRLNGSYDFNKAVKEEKDSFPRVNKKTKGILSIYKSYFSRCDAYFAKQGIKIEEKDFRS